ncbi:MAG: serine protease [Chiayiivirga sp.]|nr:serine protease [Chiayiivirga sp.]
MNRADSKRGYEPLLSTAPIFRFDFSGEAHLIGTGFWITDRGHLITAWHVIADNIGDDGVDKGPILAIQRVADGSSVVRMLRKSDKHSTIDIALSETAPYIEGEHPPTIAQVMTLEVPAMGSKVFTHAFTLGRRPESARGFCATSFNATLQETATGAEYDLACEAHVGSGNVVAVHPERRDAVMLPFPCFQSDVPLHPAHSGGPIFDQFGRVCGINCSSYEGVDVSFHALVQGVLALRARDVEFIPEDPTPRQRTILELGLARRVLFHPPVERFLSPWWYRWALWPYQRFLDVLETIRWRLVESHRRRQVQREDRRPPPRD